MIYPNELYCGDALEYMKSLPNESVDLVLTDPPYGEFGKHKCLNNDIDSTWLANMIRAVAPKIKTNGSIYVFLGSFPVASDVYSQLKDCDALQFNSFLIWDKGAFRSISWKTENNTLRSWFQTCEYMIYYNRKHESQTLWNKTGLQVVHSNAECFQSLKDWYHHELKRLGKTERDLHVFYTKITGRKPNMFRHYFCNSQFEIPTETIYNTVFKPFGFRREYEGFQREYEDLRREYEDLRPYHNSDSEHCSILHYAPPNGSLSNRHPCQKPVELLRRLIRVSCRPGGTVFDPFMGSGSTGIAAVNEDRDFIGCELDPHWYEVAKTKIETAYNSSFAN